MSDSKGAYIHKARIEGYKSIVKAEVELSSGLNIVIGKNGAGKSNLVDALAGLLLDRKGQIGTATVETEVVNGGGEVANFSSRFLNGSVVVKSDRTLLNVLNSSGALSLGMENVELQSNPDKNLELISIPHLLPNDIPFLDRRMDVTVQRFHLKADELWKVLIDECEPYFARAMAAELFHLVRSQFADLESGNDENSAMHMWADEIIRAMNEPLAAISPIEKMRLSESVAYRDIHSTDSAHLMNIAFEFKIGQEWLEFDQLSDGTRRMVYIAFSIAGPRSGFPTQSGINHLAFRIKPQKIVLLEEPELGIHPHQLHLLLLFLKEQAKTHQVILTTHSPQVLDILDKDELDRIIIASYDSKKGSQFRHLDEAQKSKALAYMEDMLLSDYWRFSDLEPRIAV